MTMHFISLNQIPMLFSYVKWDRMKQMSEFHFLCLGLKDKKVKIIILQGAVLERSRRLEVSSVMSPAVIFTEKITLSFSIH